MDFFLHVSLHLVSGDGGKLRKLWYYCLLSVLRSAISWKLDAKVRYQYRSKLVEKSVYKHHVLWGTVVLSNILSSEN